MYDAKQEKFKNPIYNGSLNAQRIIDHIILKLPRFIKITKANIGKVHSRLIQWILSIQEKYAILTALKCLINTLTISQAFKPLNHNEKSIEYLKYKNNKRDGNILTHRPANITSLHPKSSFPILQ